MNKLRTIILSSIIAIQFFIIITLVFQKTETEDFFIIRDNESPFSHAFFLLHSKSNETHGYIALDELYRFLLISLVDNAGRSLIANFDGGKLNNYIIVDENLGYRKQTVIFDTARNITEENVVFHREIFGQREKVYVVNFSLEKPVIIEKNFQEIFGFTIDGEK